MFINLKFSKPSNNTPKTSKRFVSKRRQKAFRQSISRISAHKIRGCHNNKVGHVKMKGIRQRYDFRDLDRSISLQQALCVSKQPSRMSTYITGLQLLVSRRFYSKKYFHELRNISLMY